MGAQLRVYRRRIKSVQATKKITRAMELIAASRIVKAQQRVVASTPYAEAITETVTIVASSSSTDHILTTERDDPGKVAVLVVTSDRGLAGAYSTNALRTTEQLIARLREDGRDPVPYVIGRKGVGYYRFRNRDVGETWTGFSEQPQYENAKEVATALIDAFRAGSAEGGVDELHLVYTKFESMVTQRPQAVRMLPLVVEETEDRTEGPVPLYEFEPSAEGVLDALLPRYVESRIWNALLQSAASESAARRRAMKSASDNADDLITAYTRAANAARQAEITQEIMEIVGGAEALAATGE
ncbi:MAG: F-type H+-transporting ATPase subunit gamma [Actinomycetota bacterium]|jgi:F-type H+-transporting ATPase subunit gamma|nr:F-type H+-transporting ATPase subunit gamma [Actinomycetota bacterium]